MRKAGMLYVLDKDTSNQRFLLEIGTSLGLKPVALRSLAQFLEQYRPDRPACLIAEIRLDSLDFIDLQERIRTRSLQVPVIFFTGYADVEAAVEAMKCGAFDFLQKPCGAQRLANRISQAIAQDEQQLQIRVRQSAAIKRLGALTEREHRIAELFSVGKETKQIARQLRISAKTVDFHRGNAFRKLGVSNVAQLVHLLLAAKKLATD